MRVLWEALHAGKVTGEKPPQPDRFRRLFAFPNLAMRRHKDRPRDYSRGLSANLNSVSATPIP